MMVRISYGTAVKMGLKRGKLMAEPTTAYIMLGERCNSNCSFCTQRRDSPREGFLSRVLWLPYDSSVLQSIRGFSRICFQTLDYPDVVEDLLKILPSLPRIPVSVSIVPISREDMLRLKEGGVEILSIALDAANPEIFKRVKGEGVGNRFTWENHWKALLDAREIFGKANTHLIVGLGESDEDLYSTMVRAYDEDIFVALFSYTPVLHGEPPSLGRYRAIQLMRFLISKGYRDFAHFDSHGKVESILIPKEEEEEVRRGIPFLTSGCPGCNRPFYNERPGKEVYNYPGMPVDGLSRIKESEEYVRILWE